MPRASPLIAALNAGEWSPRLYAREDLPKYTKACRRLENFLPVPQGPITYRQGTTYVAASKSDGVARLIPFVFGTTQAYVLEFGDLYIRVFKDRGVVESSPGTPYEIVSPYAVADLAELKWAQSADVLYLVHPDYAARTLSRTGHTAWTIATFGNKDGPYLSLNTTSTTITASAVTGSGITLTASAALFNADMVGSFIRLEEPSGTIPQKEWTAGESVTSGSTLRQYLGRLYIAASTATTGNHPPTHTEGTASDGGADWTYQHDGAGHVLVTAFTDTTHVTATVVTRLPGTAATKRWRLAAWSDDQGYPAAVSFHEERLWFAGTPAQPQTLWSSASGDFVQFEPNLADGRVEDDTAITVTIADDQVNAIRWLNSGKVMTIGTSGGEFSLQASNANEAITPTNITVRRETTRQVADIPPVKIGPNVLFIQRARRKIYEIGYSFEADAYQASDASILAEHIGRPRFGGLAWQAEPYSILWAFRDDGMLCGLTYEPEQEVYAWHRHPIGGTDAKVLSLAVIPGDAEDELWLLVERTVNGATKRYVELLSDSFYPDEALTDEENKGAAFFVDSGLSYDGFTTTVITGLDHLEGETVTILADGAAHPAKVVASGQVTLDRPTQMAHIGLGYTGIMETVDLNHGAVTGTGRGRPKRISRVALTFHKTLGAKVGPSTEKLERVQFRTGGDPMNQSPPLFSGEKRVTFPGGWEGEVRIVVVQDQPLPCTLVALAPRMTTVDE